MRIFLPTLIITLLSACSIVTVPVKVATKTVETAVDVTTTAVDIAIPDKNEDNTKSQE